MYVAYFFQEANTPRERRSTDAQSGPVLTGVQYLVGRGEREVEEVGHGPAGDVEHGLHPQGHLRPPLHRVGRHVQLLLGAHDDRRLAGWMDGWMC